MKKIPLIIDTDPGIDDAVAIAIALNSDEIDVKLISSVTGNVGIENTTLNALKLVTFLNKNVKVAKGFNQPLIRKQQLATNVHGISGMDGYNFPEPNLDLLSENHAVIEMAKILKESNEPITIMAIGILTNVAILLRMYPELMCKIKEIVLMGGAINRGNKGIYSEFNIATDPEAAKIVFESSLDIVMAPMDVGLKALVYPEDSEKIKKMNKTGTMFYSLFKRYRGGSFATGLKMYDSCAIAYILNPDLFIAEKLYVAVDTQNDISAGQTYVDLKGYLKKEPNLTVLTDINAKAFKTWFLSAIEKCN